MNLLKIFGIFIISSIISKGDPNDVVTDGLAIPISQKSVDLICYYEIGGGQREFEKYYSRPEVPAWRTTSSGVTVLIGYDVGQYSKERIYNDLNGLIKDEDIKLLQSVAGMKGSNAYYNGLPKVKYKLKFTWDEALNVFKKRTLPSFTKDTANAFALSYDRLHPHSNGALTSIVYNRGSSMSGDSRKEMRWIKYNISVNKEDRVPSDIKSMKRLWGPSLKGLWLRRDAEAKLFQEGLDSKTN